MNKRKIFLLISIIIICVLVITGFTFFKLTEPSEKPKFHIYDVRSEISRDRIAFNLQNLGNIEATKVTIEFEIKIAPNPDPVVLWGGWSSLWFNDTLTINIIESKETNTYYITEIIDFIESANVSQSYRLRLPEPIPVTDSALYVLESHWNIACAEGVTEIFDFH